MSEHETCEVGSKSLPAVEFMVRYFEPYGGDFWQYCRGPVEHELLSALYIHLDEVDVIETAHAAKFVKCTGGDGNGFLKFDPAVHGVWLGRGK